MTSSDAQVSVEEATGGAGPSLDRDQPGDTEIKGAGGPGAIKDRYIVVLRDEHTDADKVPVTATKLAGQYGGSVLASYGTVMRGFSVSLPEASARRLATNPAVAYVEQDRQVKISETQTRPTWGLDRADQRALPLSGSYTYPNTASNVTAYVIDTGVRITHQEFGGRASYGYDAVDGDAEATDCHGHGTHVAGTIAGATYGVAKRAKVVAVRVFDCTGNGPISGIIAGVEWVTRHAVKPAVANMSLTASSPALDDAVRRSIASGVTYAVAAGNEHTDACQYSPARLPEAITVGATDKSDTRAGFSNYGRCLDIFAPGDAILSAGKDSNTAAVLNSGTSMATPHVAGSAALILAANPDATPKQVRDTLVAHATAGAVTNAGPGSPNALVLVGPTTIAVPKTPTAGCTVSSSVNMDVDDLSSVDSTLTVANCTGKASTRSTVEVHVKHADRGDLTLTLIAPDGTPYRLQTATVDDDATNLDRIYTLNLGAQIRNGRWTLRVQDVHEGDAGYLDGWTLTL